MQKKFLFSVIITIYDAEEFLEDAIKSITRQTIDFKKNIQLILVNNATEDNSEEICLKYKNKYPENIEYVKLKKNRGPAGGRNAGIKYIKGKYFNYLDADDKWELDVFKKAYDFLEKHYENIDIVSCRRKHFGRESSYHVLDFKFTNENRIIDIFEEPEAIQLHVTSCFFKTENCINYLFDEQIGIGEDSEYVEKIILNKGKYGVLKDNINYLYRKREDGKSALDGKESKKSYFLNDYIKILESLIKNSNKKYGKVIPFIQYHMAYETGWLLRSNCSILDDSEISDLKKRVIEFLEFIDDKIILNIKVMKREHKIFALNLKHKNESYSNNLDLSLLKEYNLFNPLSKKNLLLKIIDIRNEKLLISFQSNIFLSDERWKIYLKNKKKDIYYPTRMCCTNDSLKSLGETIFYKNGYFWEIDISAIASLCLQPVILIDNVEYYCNFSCSDFVKATNASENSFFTKKIKDDKYYLKIVGKKIKVFKSNRKNYYEIKYLISLLKKFKLNVIFLRVIAKIIKSFERKKVLLISDRIHMSDDNGELFYKWIVKNKLNDVNAYYVVSKKCSDRKRIKKYGKIVYYGSLKYKILYINAHAIISSMVDHFIYSLPFGKNNIYMMDKNKNRVCLGHGVSEQDMAKTEGMYALNLQMYTVASKRESNAKTTEKYGYTDKEIKITGISRYDYIYDLSLSEKGKKILFAPTWRKSLAGFYNKGINSYNYKFKDSNYFKFFNNLINDQRILNAMKEHGYTGVFNIHPAIKANIIDFESNELIKIQEKNDSYINQFKENRLVVTDYSSIANDYAYAKSAVIYSQFDFDTFYKNHTYNKGTFDYEKDGFGPVCYDYETTVKKIIEAIESNCKVEKKYEVRRNNYFMYFDNKNCQRIYDEIMKLEE